MKVQAGKTYVMSNNRLVRLRTLDSEDSDWVIRRYNYGYNYGSNIPHLSQRCMYFSSEGDPGIYLPGHKIVREAGSLEEALLLEEFHNDEN